MDLELATGETIYVDLDIYEEVGHLPWRKAGSGSNVYRNFRHQGKVKTESLASVVTGEALGKGEVWARRDGDWRNFTRENLVIAPRGYHLDGIRDEALEKANRVLERLGAKHRRPSGATGLRGVTASSKKYKAMATVKGKQRYLGLFETPEQAAYAYDLALKMEGLEPVNAPELDELSRAVVEESFKKKSAKWE